MTYNYFFKTFLCISNDELVASRAMLCFVYLYEMCGRPCGCLLCTAEVGNKEKWLSYVIKASL